MEETVRVNFSDFGRTKDYQLVCDSNVHVHVSRIPLKGGYSLVTAYVINKRKNPANSAESIMFQVELKACAEDGSAVFIAEHICRKILASDEFYFEQRPTLHLLLGKGYILATKCPGYFYTQVALTKKDRSEDWWNLEILIR